MSKKKSTGFRGMGKVGVRPEDRPNLPRSTSDNLNSSSNDTLTNSEGIDDF